MYEIARIDTVQPTTFIAYYTFKVCREDVANVKRASWSKKHELELLDILGIANIVLQIDKAKPGDIIHLRMAADFIPLQNGDRRQKYSATCMRYTLHVKEEMIVVYRDDYR